MKPHFSLNLSHEGILLLHRSAGGGWTAAGEIALDDPDLAKNMAFLRTTAQGLEGKGFGTKLIIPESHVLYREIHAPGPGEAERLQQIYAELKATTGIDPDDLLIEWRAKGAIVEVAGVEKSTLDEAEEFAVEHRFNPICFAGHPGELFPDWEPDFGKTDFSVAFLGAETDTAPPLNETTGEPEPEVASQTEPNILAHGPAVADAHPPARETKEPVSNLFTEDGQRQDMTAPEAGGAKSPDISSFEPAAEARFASRREGRAGDVETDEHPVTRIPARIALKAEAGKPAKSRKVPTPEVGKPAAKLPPANRRTRTDKRPARTPANLSRVKRALNRGRSRLGPRTRRVARKVRASAGFAWRAFRKLSKFRPAKAPKSGLSPPTQKPAGGVVSILRNDRRVLITATATVILFVLVGLLFAMLSAKNNVTADNNDETRQPASATSLSERGVRADNRARARPSDLAANVATSITEPVTPPSALSLRRPERRSKYEETTDPIAGLPDTAETVSEFSDRELADIRAAGFQPPTKEELAETESAGAPALETREEIQTAYDATGILQALRIPPTPDADRERDDIYVASVDPELGANDATLLPDFNSGPQDDQPARKMSPLGPNVSFDLDANGLVKATKEGTLNPDGILVMAGKPKFTPPVKPKTEDLVPPDPLAAQQPKPRPADLRTGEDAIFVQGRLTLSQLRAKRGRPRPPSVQSELATDDATPSELAVLASYQPPQRPSDFDKTVEKTRVRIAAATPATGPIPDTGPILPTRASVAKRATIKNAINLSQLSLIGIYGTEASRRALMRLPSGRFVKVKKGDRIDGGQIAAIGIDTLSYVKGGRTRKLKMPKE